MEAIDPNNEQYPQSCSRRGWGAWLDGHTVTAMGKKQIMRWLAQTTFTGEVFEVKFHCRRACKNTKRASDTSDQEQMWRRGETDASQRGDAY